MTSDLKTSATGGRGALRSIPLMGVIYVVHEAVKLGFSNGHPDWCNLGQGQPEVGPIEGAPERLSSLQMEPGDHAYGPIDGSFELRSAIAAHYNRLFRAGRKSKYSAANVSVAAGGRLVLTRIFAALGEGRLGYQIPDYTAYEDMIAYHQHRMTPVMIEALEQDGFVVPPERLKRFVVENQLDAFLVSNPCNPTGRVVRGEELQEYVNLGKQEGCTLILDEFYSHFHFEGDSPAAGPVSAASHIEDVEAEPILLVDGLTKNFRYPGWRIGWAIGPKAMIESLGCAASAIDGGPNLPLQRAALEVLEAGRADQETQAVREVFSAKRNEMVRRLKGMGIRIAVEPEGTFYVWASIAGLKAPFNDADHFFREALKAKVLTVPGRFFDVNPGKLRPEPSPLASWMRFSFGPPMENMRMGLERLEKMLS